MKNSFPFHLRALGLLAVFITVSAWTSPSDAAPRRDDPDPLCSCTPFATAGACGTGGCGPTSHPEVRDCSPAACEVQTQCVPDCACGSTVDANGHACPVAAPNPPAAAPYSNVSATGLQANWSANGNPAGTLYSTILSVAPSPSTNGLASNLTVSGQELSKVFAGLAVNGAYFVDVNASNGSGQSSAFTSLGQVTTLANPPGARGPSDLLPTELTANWDAGGNPAGTPYTFQISQDPGMTAQVQTFSTTGTSFHVTGLAPSTPYFMQVFATNSAGIPTAVTALPPATTLPLSVHSPTLSGNALSDTSIQWAWTAVENATGYRLVDSNGNNISGDLPAQKLSFMESALNVNTPYSRRVIALLGPVQAISNDLSRFTFARPPASIRAFDVTRSSVSVGWSANGNPNQWTRYRVSATDTSGGVVTNDFAATQGTLSPLTPGTTYTIQVQSLNGDNIPSAAGLGSGGQQDRIQIVTLGSAAAAALNVARIFPNPFRPFSGDTQVTFDRLPAATEIKIYTLTGEKVRSLTADASGTVNWDGRNDHGQSVASGVYFALLKSGGDKRTVKLAVER